MIEIQNLDEFNGSILLGITVGVGSLVFGFSTNVQLIVQCRFELITKEHVESGHGEDPLSSPVLFSCLNKEVIRSSMGFDSVLRLEFDDGNVLKIVPEMGGVEPYVVSTSAGIFPVFARQE